MDKTVVRGEEARGAGLGKKGKVIKYKLVVTAMSQGLDCSTGNIFHAVMAVCGARRVPEASGGPHCRVHDF